MPTVLLIPLSGLEALRFYPESVEASAFLKEHTARLNAYVRYLQRAGIGSMDRLGIVTLTAQRKQTRFPTTDLESDFRLIDRFFV